MMCIQCRDHFLALFIESFGRVSAANPTINFETSVAYLLCNDL